MGKHLISNLKRVGYAGVAAVLTLVAMPIMPIAEAWADALATEVGSCDELTAALADDSTTINLTTSLTGCSTATVTKGKTIDGGGNSITFVSNDGFYINTNEAVQFKDLSITAVQMGVVVPDGGATASNLTFDGVTIDALYRGLSYYEAQDGAKLTIKDSIIQNSSITNYDTDWSDAAGHPAGTRGISFGEFKHSTANITDTTIQGFKYVVNFTQYSDVGSTFNLSGVTLKGWADLNLWQSDATINVTNSDLLGIMAKSDTSAWNNFGDIKFNDGANYNKLTLNNVRLKNAYPYATEGGVAQQAMLIDFGSHNNITMENCDFDDTLSGRLEYAIWDAGNTNIAVSSGVYDLPIEEAYLAEGKVNYLVDGRYVVDDAPVVDNVPARVLVEASIDTQIDGLDDDSIQNYGQFKANGGNFTKPNTLNATRLSNSSDLKLTFDIYNYDQNGEIVRDASYDKVTKVHAYQADEIDDVYMAKGSSKSDLALTFTSNPYTTLEVKTSDENIATISKNDTDGNYTVEAKENGTATILGKVSVADLATEWIELGTINVYSFTAKSSILIPAGTELSLTDERLTNIGNPGVITAAITEGEQSVSLSGDTATNAKITANAKGNATLEYYVNGEKVGQTIVKVYEKQNPQDIVLKTLLSQGGGDVLKFIDLRDTNIRLRDYSLSADNQNILISNTLKTITARSAGESTVTVSYNDDLGGTTETFKVRVSDFTDNSDRNGYDIAQGEQISFRMSEAYDQNSVVCEIEGSACEENDELTITKQMNNGRYTVEATDTAAGEYKLKFTDTVGGVTIAERTVTVRVHEIEVLDESGEDVEELYIKKGDSVTVTADEKNDLGEICEDVWHNTTYFPYRPGHYERECNIEIDGSSNDGVAYTEDGDDKYTIAANEAGEYIITFSDGVAEKTVTVYVFDFEVKDLEYHVTTTDTAQHLINAINRYWVDTNNSAVRNMFGFPTNSIVMTKVTSGDTSTEGEEYFFWPGQNANAGRYTVDFSALVNGTVVDTQTVTIYLYEMYHPSQTEYYGAISGLNNVFLVNVGDWINLTNRGMAQISYEVVEGDTTGITVSTTTGLVYVTKPGKYVVKYTDTMNRGEGDVAGEYTATFEVYNLDANAPDNQIVDISAAETYDYTINHTNTYGDTRVTITLTRDNETTEVFNETLNYPGVTTDDFTFTPTEEGRYDVRIENLAATEHGFREIETGSFYVIASEYDFIMVEAGETVEIESNSYWNVTSAELDSEQIEVEDGKKVTIDTTDMSLGVHNIDLYHRFNRRQTESLKNVTLVIYKVAPGEDTQELNPGKVTVSTVKGLYEDTAKATADLTRKMIARNIPVEQVIEFMVKMWDGTLTDEDIEALGVTDLFEEFKEALGAKDNEWLDTLNNLNEAALYGDEVTVDVEVTPINDSVNAIEKAEIEKALASYNVDHIDYYDVSVLLKVNGDELGKLHKLNGKITVALAQVENPAAGYSRQYFVVRDHEGTVTVLTEGVDFYIEDGIIYVISDEFSTYAVAYKDTLLPKSPDTGEETATEGGVASVTTSTAVVVAIAALVLVGAAIFAKRK